MKNILIILAIILMASCGSDDDCGCVFSVRRLEKPTTNGQFEPYKSMVDETMCEAQYNEFWSIDDQNEVWRGDFSPNFVFPFGWPYTDASGVDWYIIVDRDCTNL